LAARVCQRPERGHEIPGPGLAINGDQILRSATQYCETNPGSTIAAAANVWYAAAPKPTAAPQQAEAKKDDDSWVRLNLTAPSRKPLLDRH